MQQKLEELIKNSIGATYSGYIRISREILNDDNQEKELAKIKVTKVLEVHMLKLIIPMYFMLEEMDNQIV